MDEDTASRKPQGEAQRSAPSDSLKRFYKTVTITEREAAFAVLLDGREVRTPGRNRVAVRDVTVAEALRREWDAQETHIQPHRMPLTRIVNTALDRVADQTEAVRADIVRFADSDLVLYRAEGPPDLIAEEDAAWDPLLAWAAADLGASLQPLTGIVYVAQDAEALAAIAEALAPFDALELTALHTVTTLTGSAVIALAVALGRMSPTEAWTAAHVDEDWQMRQWSRDAAALEMRAVRWLEMEAAALVLANRATAA